MARPYFTAKHVESMVLLPNNLEIGRAYFVDDEQVIVIDHGRGPVVYGKSPGPQGIAGEPIPQLQDQIDTLSEAVLITNKTIWDINEREKLEAAQTDSDFLETYRFVNRTTERLEQNLTERVANETVMRKAAINNMQLQHDLDIRTERQHTDSEIERVSQEHTNDVATLQQVIAENLQHSDSLTQERFDFVKELTDHNAEAIASLINTLQTQFAKYDSALNILARSISELYPEHFAPEDSQNDPLDNETISTDAGSWTIQQTILKDGTVVLNLAATELVIDTLKIGDSVDFDGGYWTVENISTTDGVTSITIKP